MDEPIIMREAGNVRGQQCGFQSSETVFTEAESINGLEQSDSIFQDSLADPGLDLILSQTRSQRHFVMFQMRSLIYGNTVSHQVRIKCGKPYRKFMHSFVLDVIQSIGVTLIQK